MRDLIQQERFEIEVLDRLNSRRLLSQLIFTGGTMLRLCYGLNRFSVDLDFWVGRRLRYAALFAKLRESLAELYTITDCARKFYTLLYELKSPDYSRRLKIEIRSGPRRVKTEMAIAYSQFTTTQVLVRVPALPEIMAAKVAAFLSRREVRDAFDIEFLLKRGVPLPDEPERLKGLLSGLERLSDQDYKVQLGSLLTAEFRRYYTKENFRLLKMAIAERLNRVRV
ncbi:MAG: nucleotidyl transferase AbiEii/AbiGii toxin family protein [candidate division WOR-3 bacterium]